MLTVSGRVALGAGLLLVVVAVVTDWVELGYLGLFLVLAVAVAIPMAWVRPRLEVERVIEPVRVTVGDPSLGLVRVSNESIRPVGSMSAEEVIGDARLPIAIPNLAPGGRKEVRYRLPTDRRAVLTVGPLAMVREDPFGFARFEQRRGDEATLWVHPRRYPLTAMPTSFFRTLEGPTSDSAPQGTVNFHAIRDYVHGDDLRLVHWRTTARTGSLMVKQNVDTTQPDLTLLVDTRRDRITADGFEVAMEIAASLVCACSEQRYPVRLRTIAGQSFQPVRNEAPAQFFLDRLAGLERSDAGSMESSLAELRLGSGGVNLVVVSARTTSDDIAGVVSLKRRFRSMALVDIDTERRETTTTPRSGLMTFEVATGEEFASAWNRAVR